METRVNFIIESIKNWFNINGFGCNAVIGISGGKDSTIVAALCAAALGRDRVIGVSMPDEHQDSKLAKEICAFLGIKFMEVPVWQMVACMNSVVKTNQAKVNLPPRLRMAILYAVAQSNNGRVMNTSNLSEDWIGYSTRWGDAVGDLSVLANYTVKEILQIGMALKLPKDWVYKTPDDGLQGSVPDEEKFGFTYEELDEYIRTGNCESIETRKTIDRLHRASRFKMNMPESIPYYALDKY